MKKGRIMVLSVIFIALLSLFSGIFSPNGTIGSLVLAGYGGTATDKKDPSIKHAQINLAYIGEEIKFSATVKDSDSGVDSVKLRYRIDGGEWRSRKMKNNKSRVYRTSLTAPVKAGTLEYYIKAEDEAGNVKYSGKSSSPYAIKIAYRPKPATAKVLTKETKTETVSPVSAQSQPVEEEIKEEPRNEEQIQDQNKTEEANEDEQLILDAEDDDSGSNMFNNIIFGLLLIFAITLGAWFFSRKKTE